MQENMWCLQYLGDLGCEHLVYKNDEKTIEELRALNPRGILLSPGPGQWVYTHHVCSVSPASLHDQVAITGSLFLHGWHAFCTV